MALLKHNHILAFCFCLSSASAIAAKDIIQGHIGGMTNQINRDVGDVPGNRYNGDLQFSYHRSSPYELDRKFDFAALVNDQSLAMWSVQEAYIGTKGVFRGWDHLDKTGDQLKVGRHILPWSQIDSTWGLGKLNNRKNFDGFEPGQEGLIGMTYENKSSSGFFWSVFGSPIYAPEMNPSLDINKGDNTITSRNPWADAPAPSTDVGGKDTPIQYIVDYPEVSDVVRRYSIGANVGWESKHWLANFHYIRKPENQISTQVDVKLPEDSGSVKAFITPQFYYHDVFGANAKYRNADLEIYLGGIAIFPNTFPDGAQKATTATEIKTEKRREAYGGGGISKINDKYGIGLNYVARLSPYDRELDSLAQDPRWNQALNFFGMINLKRKFSLSADLKYDMLTTDRLFMLRTGYKVSKVLLINFGVNMIGTPESGKSYWSPYTNNDAVYAGLRYLF